jgi:TRAP-type C4-dicarboxylate transport system permease small subunit
VFNVLIRGIDRLAQAMMVATAFVAFGMAFAILIEIVCRLLGIKYYGTAEHIRNLLILIVFLQLPYAVRSRSMLFVDIFHNLMPGRLKSLNYKFCALLGALFFMVLAYGAIDPAVRAWVENEYEGEGVVDVPAWPARFAILVGSGMTAWFYLLRILGVESTLKTPERKDVL